MALRVNPDYRLVAGNSTMFVRDNIQPHPDCWRGLISGVTHHPYTRSIAEASFRAGDNLRGIDDIVLTARALLRHDRAGRCLHGKRPVEHRLWSRLDLQQYRVCGHDPFPGRSGPSRGHLAGGRVTLGRYFCKSEIRDRCGENAAACVGIDGALEGGGGTSERRNQSRGNLKFRMSDPHFLTIDSLEGRIVIFRSGKP
jgi:hypothetical protein